MATIHVPEEFEVQLVACEPMVTSPVAIDWGIDGKLWVVEMADYPMGIDGNMKPGGRVRILEDTDGDGRFDKSTLFLDGLNFPNGIITWRDGAIVTAAPDILFADGKSGHRETLFTGFKEGNLQLRVNGLRWGLDNWLHCANGWSGGQPRSSKTGVQIDLNGHDLRIKPDQGFIESESGQSEFGRNCNDWGDWFGCDNSNPLFHFVLEERYMRRNPHVPAPSAKRQVYLPSNPKVYPRSIGQRRYHSFEHIDHFTSACSTDFYRDELLFPRSDDAHAFICEPVHNLIQHLIVREQGVSFTARRAETGNEPDFLSSEDQWFRPVMVRTGPDGALWVVDMYRYMIEHPDWLPPEGQKDLEPFYREGEYRGRIYRIVRKGQPATVSIPRLDQMNTSDLVASLEKPNGWLRDKAQQVLIWRGDGAAVPLLEKLLSNSPQPLARLHALCTLDGLGGLRSAILEQALRDSHPAVRRQALRLAEPLAGTSPTLMEAATKLVDDPDAKVRLQLACSLGEWKTPQAGQALARLAIASAVDPTIAAAVISSAIPHVEPLVDAIAGTQGGVRELLTSPLLSLSLVLHRRDLAAELLTPVLEPQNGRFEPLQMRIFSQFLSSLSRRKESIKQLSEAKDDALAEQLRKSEALFAAARLIIANAETPSSNRVAAAELLGRNESHPSEDSVRLGTLLGTATSGDVQIAVVKALALEGANETPELLTRHWLAQGPQIRSAVLDVLFSREDWTLELLRKIERGQIAAVDLDAPHRDRLLKSRSQSIKDIAAKMLSSASTPDRRRVIEAYRPALSLEGDSARGKAVFGRLCVGCHLLDGVGREIGPNLISVKAHPPEKLMTSILDPSREVEPHYLAYTCTLTGGEELYGLIASETGNGIVMKLSDGSAREILRTEIKSLQSSKSSLMPDGLEAGINQQELADLIRYLRSQPGVD